jgi:hypothetical protein
MSLSQYIFDNNLYVCPPLSLPEVIGAMIQPTQSLEVDIKVAEYLFHSCQYSFKDYLELKPTIRQELNQATLSYLKAKVPLKG